MIWIRADAGEEIGTGHIMRCLSIAAALRELGEPVTFLLADDSAVPLLEAQGQEFRILHSFYRSPEAELDALYAVLKSRKGGLFLADGYFFTPKYLKQVRDRMPVCYMDDLGTSGLPVDILINYNIFAERSLYEQDTQDTVYFLGTEYAPLRQEFKDAYRPIRDRAERVLLTTGGSDRYDLSGKILECALHCPETADMEYCVVSGAFNQYLPHLKELEKTGAKVQVYSNVNNMVELMQFCDIAVTAGGTTMYELSAVGVPTVCFSFVDNQQKIVEGFRSREVVCFGGDYLRQGEPMIRDVVEHIALLRKDVGLRRVYSARQRALVDGHGAMRIALRLLEQMRSAN